MVSPSSSPRSHLYTMRSYRQRPCTLSACAYSARGGPAGPSAAATNRVTSLVSSPCRKTAASAPRTLSSARPSGKQRQAPSPLPPRPHSRRSPGRPAAALTNMAAGCQGGPSAPAASVAILCVSAPPRGWEERWGGTPSSVWPRPFCLATPPQPSPEGPCARRGAAAGGSGKGERKKSKNGKEGGSLCFNSPCLESSAALQLGSEWSRWGKSISPLLLRLSVER